MDQIRLGRTANHTVTHTRGYYSLHYGNQELNDYNCYGFESPIRKVAQMWLKESPLTTCEICCEHSISNKVSVAKNVAFE